MNDVLKKIHTLRKDLITICPDMISTIMSIKRKTFGEDQVVFIGAPFLEADHQLGYVFHQNIIDYIFTIDGDVIAFGVDVIKKSLHDSSGKCKLVEFADVVKDVPEQLNVNH